MKRRAMELGALGLALSLAACADDSAGDDLPEGGFTSGPAGTGADDVADTVVPMTDGGMQDSTDDGATTAPGEETGPPQEVSYAADLAPLIASTCFGSLCHDDPAPTAGGGLNLSPDGPTDPYEQLTTTAHAISNMPYVTVGQPEASFLYRKLEGTYAQGDLEGLGSGVQMPSGQPPLSDADLKLFRDWILTGAMP